jgi:membrane-associated protease RseP (regulator of RpoE activity)
MGSDGQSVYQIGVSPRPATPLSAKGCSAAKDATIETYLNMRQIVQVIGGLFSGKVSIRELQGVVGIARVSGQAAQRGPMTLLGLMAVISLNLGLLNLVPHSGAGWRPRAAPRDRGNPASRPERRH